MISIIIPTYNTGKFLKSTLESILYQDTEDYEVIVMDSHSTDGSFGLLEEYFHRFDGKMSLNIVPKEGQVKAINSGLSLAKGDIMAFINADDTYERGCFKTVIQALKPLKDEIQWVYGKGHVINENGFYTRGIVTQFKALWWSKPNRRVLSWFDYISQPTVFWKRSLWEEAGKFNPEFRLCFDYEMWLRFWKITPPLFIDRHLANWRAHSDALSVKNTNAQIDESLRINMQYAQSTWDLVIQNLVAWGEKVVYGVMK